MIFGQINPVNSSSSSIHTRSSSRLRSVSEMKVRISHTSSWIQACSTPRWLPVHRVAVQEWRLVETRCSAATVWNTSMDASKHGPVELVSPQPIPSSRRRNRHRSRNNYSGKKTNEECYVNDATWIIIFSSCLLLFHEPAFGNRKLIWNTEEGIAWKFLHKFETG